MFAKFAVNVTLATSSSVIVMVTCCVPLSLALPPDTPVISAIMVSLSSTSTSITEVTVVVPVN